MADPFDSQHFKEDVFPELLKKLKVDEIRCALFSGGLINRSELKRLKNLTSDEEKVEMLFVEILPRHVNAQEALEKFVTILRNNPRQSPLADLFASLTPNSELPTNMPESSSTAEVSTDDTMQTEVSTETGDQTNPEQSCNSPAHDSDLQGQACSSRSVQNEGQRKLGKRLSLKRKKDRTMSTVSPPKVPNAEEGNANSGLAADPEPIAVKCGKQEGSFFLDKFLSGTTSRAKSIKHQDSMLTVKEFHAKGCGGSTKGRRWEIDIYTYHDGRSIQFFLDEMHGNVYPRLRLKKMTVQKQAAYVLALDPDDRMALDPDDRMTRVVQLEDDLGQAIGHLLTLIKEMENAGVQQAPGWREVICKLQTRTKDFSEIVSTMALVGFQGVGKSTFLNSILAYNAESQNTVPVSASDVCTAVPIIVKHSSKAIRAEVHFCSLESFKKDFKICCQDLASDPDDNSEAGEVTAVSREKLQAVFGDQIGDEPTLQELEATDVWPVIKGRLDSVECIEGCTSRDELRKSLRKYLTTEKEEVGSTTMQYWPLVESVVIEVPDVKILQNGIQLCDLPGLEEDSKARTACTKEFLTERCDHAFIVTEISRASCCAKLSDLIENELAMTLVGKTFDVVITKVEDGIDNVDREELERLIKEAKLNVEDFPGIQEKKGRRTAYSTVRAMLEKEKLTKIISKQPYEKDDFKNSPKVYSVSSFEHDKLVEDDPEDRPRIFTEAKQTGIPDVKERITSIAELYRFDLFKHIHAGVDAATSRMWTSLEEYQSKDKECRMTIKCMFDGVKNKLELELLLQQNDMAEELNANMSEFYRKSFYPFLDEGLEQQQLNFDQTVSKWLKIPDKYFRCAYSRQGNYRSSQKRMLTRRTPTSVVNIDFVQDLTCHIYSSLADVWDSKFDDAVSVAVKLIKQKGDDFKEAAKQLIRKEVASALETVGISSKNLEEAEKVLNKSLDVESNKCKRSLDGIAKSVKKNATSGIREAVTDFLTPMFDDYKDIKGIKTKAIKEHVKKSMKGSKDQLFQHIRTRQKEIENDMKERVAERGRRLLQVVIKEVHDCYSFLWADMPQQQLQEVKTEWQSKLEATREKFCELEEEYHGMLP